eukprot:TRINITY_DN20850_c0_g2_i1.p1 TRINITY_DN20850_c0_g2~~TRINITY_DN20850_c0_g2_i1.p1  ORF type:complete len:580 (+),score=177.51 TRINITY_DN20850_c0_g2_i1:61-1800(+)
MQPLAYFAVRALLGWLQFVERDDRAFRSNTLLVLATGAAHCWAVVYALFIAIHTRAMRYEGYHEGYVEHLPFWVSWTETLSVASMALWWGAGFTTAAIRIADDDSPLETNVGVFIQIVRSKKLQAALELAHTVSCVGLFVSILLLCVAMALMAGSVTACELCLVFVAVGFALPHAVVAARHFELWGNKSEDASALPTPAAEAAAQEAAALGPQMCVILALADSPGHAFMWQNLIYLVSAFVFVAAVAACGKHPPKVGDAALPPDAGEFATCFLLDAAAAISLVVCFPHLNTWHLWALVALLVLLLVAIKFEYWRELLIDLIDPLFDTRSDTDKAIPSTQRQRMRKLAWGSCIACATTALWDIAMHPIQEGLFEPPDDSFLDLLDQKTMLLLRWRATSAQPPEDQLLGAAADALGVERAAVEKQEIFTDHRLLVFKVDKASQQDNAADKKTTPMHIQWKTVVKENPGKLARIVDSDFPSNLNVTLCLHAHAKAEMKNDQKEGEEASTTAAPDLLDHEDLELVVGPSKEAKAAYMKACDWWWESFTSMDAADHEDEVTDGADSSAKKDGDESHVEAGDDLA